MIINFHIDQLELINVDIQEHRKGELKAAIESTLKQKLASQGVGSFAESNIHRQSVRGSTVSIGNSHKPNSLGQQIGNAVYRGIRK